MNQYISYLIDNIRAIGVYGTLLVALFYFIYKIKCIYEENEILKKTVEEQNNNIKIQKKLLNVKQNNKPRTLSDNFKWMRSEK